MAKDNLDLDKLFQTIGYRFKDLNKITEALLHNGKAKNGNYERLEFFGDRVVNMIVAYELITAQKLEGFGAHEFHQTFVYLTSNQHFHKIAEDMSLQDYIFSILPPYKLARSENIMSDIVEAVAGAIFLDGGYEAAHDFVLNQIIYRQMVNA